MEKYIFKEKLGEGSYGVVWRVMRQGTNNSYAVKVIEGVNFFRKEEVESEVGIMMKLVHPNLVRIYESYYDETAETMSIVMDYCETGDLLHYVGSKNKDFTSQQIMGIFKQLVQAFLFMNSKGVIHRDLKPENLLVTGNGIIKIADFGCARNLKSDEISKLICMSLDKGTPCFASPELLQSQAYSFKCDVWSAGCIVYFLTYRRLPFFSKKVSQIIISIKEKLENRDIEFPYIPNLPPPTQQLKYVIRRCLKYKQKERSSWREFSLSRIFSPKMQSIKVFCEYVKSLSNIANWISKMFWKQRKAFKILNNKDEIFIYFIIKFQLSVLQLGQKVMERDVEWKYLFEDAAWANIDIDEHYYKHYREVHLKETIEYFTMLRDCPKSDSTNKAIKEKDHGMFLPFADLQNSIRYANRILVELLPSIQPKHHKVLAVISRWMNFERHFELQKKPNLQKILAEKVTSVVDQINTQLNKQIGGM